MRHIDKIVLHCSATREGKDYSVDTIRGWHTRKGWRDIGYHYIVQRNGDVQEGRPLKMQGAHTRGLNKSSIGICYIGGVESTRNKKGKWTAKDTRTEEQKSALHYFITDLMDEYPEATLHGHNEFAAKACPSFDVQEEYKDIIEYYAR